MISRSQYTQQRKEDIERIKQDRQFEQSSTDYLTLLIERRVAYQTSWMGEPVLQLPQDLLATQEILYRTRPDFIIEVGVAWAGSLLFLAHMQKVFGGKKVIGIDTFIPQDLIDRLRTKGEIANQIELIEDSSLSDSCHERLQELVAGSDNVLVHLDSNHTAEHVLSELALYSQYVGAGNYLICGDTHVELVPKGTYQGKEYDRGNNPMIALRGFLDSELGKGFRVDDDLTAKYALSLNPGGFLVRT